MVSCKSLLILAVYLHSNVFALPKATDNDQIILHKGSKSFEFWSKPATKESTLKIYIYNITNSDEIVQGKKPNLNELGPYVYKMKWDRQNIREYENGTLSFHLKKTYEFQERDSKGKSEFDMIVTPNIPMFGAIAKVKDMGVFPILGTADLFRKTQTAAFVEMTVKELLWGYEYPLLQVAKSQGNIKDDHYGFFYETDEATDDEMIIFTGSADLSKVGIIDRYSVQEEESTLLDESCHDFDGSDGSIFPPNLTKESRVHVFEKLFCRLMPLTFEKDVDSNPPSMRFTVPMNVFKFDEENDEFTCYCSEHHPCDSRGMFNISSCQHDYPLLVSFPHFYKADIVLVKGVDGVSLAEKEENEYFIDIEPNTGVALKSRRRLQINLITERHDKFDQVKNIADAILPIVWFEEAVDIKVPKYVKDITGKMKPATTTRSSQTTVNVSEKEKTQPDSAVSQKVQLTLTALAAFALYIMS